MIWIKLHSPANTQRQESIDITASRDRSVGELTMARMSKATKIENTTKLRDLAVDLVAHHGKLTPVKKGAESILVMTYEDDRIAILYKTPNVDLSTEGAPAWINPKGYMIDIWFDNAKKMSVQWDDNGPVDVLVFKTGDWEAEFVHLAPALAL